MANKLPFELQSGEEVLRDETSIWIQGGFKNRMGRLYLTSQRLVFVRQNMMLGALFGLLGMLLGSLLNKFMGTVLLDLPLREISTFENVKFGFNNKVILFHSSRGELKMGVGKAYSEWEPVLKAAMKRK